MVKVATALEKLKSILKQDRSNEAEQILIAAFRKETGKNISRIDFFTDIVDSYPVEALALAVRYAKERNSGKTLQYILGFQTFFEHQYIVKTGVLVPRPETEFMVDIAIKKLSKLEQANIYGIEVGLGSGVIAIELLSKFETLKMIGSEVSEVAVEVTKENATRILGRNWVQRFQIVRAKADQVLEPFAGQREKADFIVSNPPYLCHSDEIDEEVLSNEPKEALFPPSEDPLFFYRKIADQSLNMLEPRGLIFLEVPHERSGKIASIFNSQKFRVEVLKDLTGRDRVLVAQVGVVADG